MSYKANVFNELHLGLAFGAILGLYLLFIGLIASFFDLGTTFVEIMSSWYVGYSATILGSLIGGVWGFVDGFIFGFLVAFVYNHLQENNSRYRLGS